MVIKPSIRRAKPKQALKVLRGRAGGRGRPSGRDRVYDGSMAEATLQPTRRPSLYTLRQDKLDKRRRTRRRRKLTRTPKRARSEFLAMCQRLTTPGGFWLFVSPDAAAYVMRLTGGEVVPEMCVVA
jgi:hypothetical protein